MAIFVTRRETGDLEIRKGAKVPVEAVITVDGVETFTAASVTFTLYDGAGATVISAAAGVVGSTNTAVEHTISYSIDTSLRTAGDYVYALQCAAAAQTLIHKGFLTVIPLASRLDRYVRRIADWLRDDLMKDAVLLLSEQQYRAVARQAVADYSRGNPRRRIDTVSLTASTWEYNLPTDWVDGWSRVERLEYPVDATDQGRNWLEVDEWEVDEERSVWQFAETSPTAGESARVYYTVPHTLSDTEDTTPTADFDAICQYAAALALLALANQASHSNAPLLGADSALYRTKEQERGSRAQAMMDAAQRAWPAVESYSVGGLPF